MLAALRVKWKQGVKGLASLLTHTLVPVGSPVVQTHLADGYQRHISLQRGCTFIIICLNVYVCMYVGGYTCMCKPEFNLECFSSGVIYLCFVCLFVCQRPTNPSHPPVSIPERTCTSQSTFFKSGS